MMLKLFMKIVWETFQWVGLLGGVLGVLTGLALLFNSALVFRISERMNVWISTRKAAKALDTSIEVERAVYRAHRVIGALLLAGALYTLYMMLVHLHGAHIALAMPKFIHPQLAGWLGISLRIFFIVANVIAAVIAIVMVVRPSALKGIEAWTNRSYSARRTLKFLETPRDAFDPIVRAHPQLTGLLFTVAGAFVVFALGYGRLLR
jgi:hypothetical protein